MISGGDDPRQAEREYEGEWSAEAHERTRLLDRLYEVVTDKTITTSLDVEDRFSGEELANLIAAAKIVVAEGWDRNMDGNKRVQTLVEQISRLNPSSSQAA